MHKIATIPYNIKIVEKHYLSNDNKHLVALNCGAQRFVYNRLKVHFIAVKKWDLLRLSAPMATQTVPKDELLAVIGSTKRPLKRITIGYCRVSTFSQKKDLECQVEVVTNYCEGQGYIFKIINDIGSGINYNRKGFQEMLELICCGRCTRLL